MQFHHKKVTQEKGNDNFPVMILGHRTNDGTATMQRHHP